MSANQMNYTQRYQILSGRITFSDYVRRRKEVQEGRLLGLNLYLPDNDASIVPIVKEGEANTTQEEVNRYLGLIDPFANLNVVEDTGIPLLASPTHGDSHVVVTLSLPYEYFNDIQSYVYWVKDPSNTTTGPFTEPNTTETITVSDLINGFPYTITVRAVTTTNILTNPVILTVTPSTIPSAPTELSGTASDGQIALLFTSGNDGGADILNYKYSLDNGEYRVVDPPIVDSPLLIRGLTNDREYEIKLRAVNSNGDGIESISIRGTPSTSPSPLVV